jgi:hypothetical protein
VADTQCGELFAAAIEKWIVADNERACAHLCQDRENGIEVSFAAMRSTTLACRSGPRDILCARTTFFGSAAKSQACPLALLVIRRGFGRIALSFAQRNLLVLLSLFLLAPCCLPAYFLKRHAVGCEQQHFAIVQHARKPCTIPGGSKWTSMLVVVCL